jgi:hypothetical protein
MIDAPPLAEKPFLSEEQRRKEELHQAKLRAMELEQQRKDKMNDVRVGGALGSIAQKTAQQDDVHGAKLKELGVKPKAPLGGPTNATEKVMATAVQELNSPQPSGKIPASRVAADAAGIRGLLADPSISPDTRKIYEQELATTLAGPAPLGTADRAARDTTQWQAEFSRHNDNNDPGGVKRGILTAVGVPPIPGGAPQGVPQTGRDVLIAKQDLANSTDRATRARAQAVLDAAGQKPMTRADQYQALATGVLPQVPETQAAIAQRQVQAPLSPLPPTDVVQGRVPVTPVEAGPDVVEGTYNAAKDSQVANIAMQNQGQIAALAEAAKGKPDPESWLANALSGLFGDTGLFNKRELMRFALLGAGGMLTGGSVGGSLRYAGKDALNQSDARLANQQATSLADKKEWTAREKSLLEAGYKPEGIRKFKTTGNPNDLGEPETRYETTGKRVPYTFPDGPNRGKTFMAEERKAKTGKTAGDVGMMINGKPVPLNMIPLEDYEKGRDADIKGFDTVTKKAEEVTKNFYGQKYPSVGGKVDPSLASLPTESEIANGTTKWMRDKGFDPKSPEMHESVVGALNIALNDMRNTPSDTGTAKSIAPFLDKAMVMFNTGINSTDFMLATNKPMPPSMVSKLYHQAERAAEKRKPQNSTEKNQFATEELQRVRQQFSEFRKKYPEDVRDSKTETAFYSFAMKNLK